MAALGHRRGSLVSRPSNLAELRPRNHALVKLQMKRAASSSETLQHNLTRASDGISTKTSHEERDNRSLMRTALEIQGARVVDADGYAAALEREGPFELALVDLNLGDGRGDALLERLRREGRVQRAVLLSGSTDVELGAQGEPDAVLRKPFELEELHLVIERVLGTSSREAEEEEAEG